ncbi:nucleotidyltransferase family protein [Williamsia deligens]|uniref:NTP transferase domain-containing protein n=1 Tax=Williamsia deligens TaxID=321325 RepID=A0ABW3G4J6_9NOCA|nr:nicotine blue oxidoreductase [Williamsia deligens]
MTHACNERPSCVPGVVLAAGAGTRFGSPKVLADNGRWLSGAIGALARGGCAPVFVTLGAAQVEVPAPAEAVEVPDWQDGVSASVRAGLAAATAVPGMAGVVLTLVDLPDVTSGVVARVLSVADRSPSGLVRAVYDGAPGHPVYLGRDHLDAVMRTVHGDRGAGRLLDRHPEVLTVECGDLATGRDVDRPD